MDYTLITGASSGIGKELAIECARHGHNLILVARREQRLYHLKKQLQADFKIQVEVIPFDLSQPNSAKVLFQITQNQGLLVENLINNAGVGAWGKFLHLDWNQQSALIQLNLNTLTELTYLYGQDMLRYNRGRILNIASTAAFGGGPMMALYYATKAYVLSFSEALAEELKASPISVSVLCPGPTRTEFEQASGMKNSKMFTLLPTVSPRSVARAGYKAMVTGKPIKYHSFNTYAFNMGGRVLPRAWWRKIAHFINGYDR